jgi:biopolymer transport protein ExbD
LAPYLPKAPPVAVEDRAEAEAPVDLGFQTSRTVEGEDEDVDMIPLIDVSLVLLIFFMMTTAIASGVFSPIPTPAAQHQLATITGDMYWLGIEIKGDITKFSLGKDSDKKKHLLDPTEDGTKILDALTSELNGVQGEVKLRLRADKRLSIDTIKQVTLDLQDLESTLNRGREPNQRLQLTVLGEVSEPAK